MNAGVGASELFSSLSLSHSYESLEFRYMTELRLVDHKRKALGEVLTSEFARAEYAPRITPDGQLLRTRIQWGRAWLVLSKLDGADERTLTQGQFGELAPKAFPPHKQSAR